MSAPISGQPESVNVIVTMHPQGMYTVEFKEDGVYRRTQGASLESALGKAAGENAPDNYVLHAAAIIRGVLQKGKQ